MPELQLSNPYRPGAGHRPPFLAGRSEERREFDRLLQQNPVLENMVLTGLRGVGKTVLLDEFKASALQQGWLWVGTDLSEAASLSEERLCTRLITDLAAAVAGVQTGVREVHAFGFTTEAPTIAPTAITHQMLVDLYNGTPGLPSDRLKAVIFAVRSALESTNVTGIAFAYDEAQNLADHSANDEFPLSLLLDVFQSLQRNGQDLPLLLVLTGLPTLFPKLVEARTFAERMFRVVFLDRLSPEECREAIERPVTDVACPIEFTEDSVREIVRWSAGYPYFVQFLCREVFDVWVRRHNLNQELGSVELDPVIRKLDDDFFAGRWSRATDRQRDLLRVVSELDTAGSEFTVAEVVAHSQSLLDKPFSPSHVNQIFVALIKSGLIYKNRHGRYSLAVPLLDQFIRRQYADGFDWVDPTGAGQPG